MKPSLCQIEDHQTAFGLFVAILAVCGSALDAAAQTTATKANPTETKIRHGTSDVIPNRTLPKVSPPKTELEFSAKPTVQEIFRARVFEESLVPIGGEPSADENAALAAALLGYAKRTGSDDFASLTGFLDKHPNSPWRAALLTCLGVDYYNTAHYSLALEAWEKAWPLAKGCGGPEGQSHC